jgi:hypothetical protein
MSDLKLYEEFVQSLREEYLLEKEYSAFIHFLGLSESDVMDQKIKNPTTGRAIKVASALKYDKNTDVYKTASNLLDKDEKPSEDEGKKAGLKKTIDTIEQQISEVKDPDQKKTAKEVLGLAKMIDDPNTSAEDKKKAFGKLVEDGVITKNAGGTKFYVNTEKTGLYRKVFGEKKSPTSMVAVGEEFGLDNIPKEQQNKIDKKAMTAAKLFGDKESNVKVDVSEKGIKFDGMEINHQEVPSIEKLTEIYGSKKEAEKAKKALEKYNQVLEISKKSFGSGELKTLSALPDTPPSTPENRQKLKNATADILSGGIEKQFEGKKMSESQKAVIEGFKSLKDIKDPKEYDDKIMKLTGDMMNDPYLESGVADTVEMVSYMRELNKGNVAYLPAASNYPLGDIISISPEKIDFKKDSPAEIQRKINLIMTGVESRSIKKDAGGASASGDKTALSNFKPYKNKSGKTFSSEQVKKDIDRLSNKEGLYKDIFDKDTAKAQKEINDLAKNFDFNTEDPSYKERKNKSVASAVASIKKKNPNIDEKDLKEKLSAYYDLGNVYQHSYNQSIESQLFTNEVWKYDKKSGKAVADRTDGIGSVSKLAFEFNIGFSGTGRPSNAVPTRFKNTKLEE